MSLPRNAHWVAVLQALLVTFLWATSWVLIKVGLSDLPALTFAGLRYGLAFVCLLPFNLRGAARPALRQLTRRDWVRLVALGLLFYALTQGAQFLGLQLLPAVTVSLLLNFTTLAVALLGIGWLGERPTRAQWLGIALFLGGVLIYFFPVALPASELLGVGVVLVGVLANAGSSLLGRQINREAQLPPLLITTISMGVGAAVLLLAGLLAQGLPTLTASSVLIVVWLAVVNTAFAFTLWNHTLRTLSAAESSIINSTMLIQIAVLAWLFLGEPLTLRASAGLALAAFGMLVVQRRRGRD